PAGGKASGCGGLIGCRNEESGRGNPAALSEIAASESLPGIAHVKHRLPASIFLFSPDRRVLAIGGGQFAVFVSGTEFVAAVGIAKISAGGNPSTRRRPEKMVVGIVKEAHGFRDFRFAV